MVSFFGTRSKTFSGSALQHLTCDDCENRTVRPYTTYKYFHMLWVPFFPYKKITATECTHCGKRQVQFDVSLATHAAIKREKKSAKPPAYLFVGAFCVALLIIYAGYMKRAESQASDRYFTSPMVNDLYIVDYNKLLAIDEFDYRYGVFKIDHVAPDSIRFRVGTYGYRFPGDAKTAIKKDDVASPEYFYEGNLAFSRAEMQMFFDERHVKKIIRPN